MLPKIILKHSRKLLKMKFYLIRKELFVQSSKKFALKLSQRQKNFCIGKVEPLRNTWSRPQEIDIIKELTQLK